ncbi:MAG: mandelate racemase/muconate lactonizing enzyme family protein [Planctomycetia bacterium]|nr:mandelate racemase/muconate lactonizing enzyme family protein [Planctomycetia bacterium]
MKITQVEAIELRLHEIVEKTSGAQDTLVVRVHTDSGLVGIGEIDSSPRVSKAIIDAPVSHTIVRGLAHVLLGADAVENEVLWRKMYDATVYMGRKAAVIHTMAGIDVALWDLKGKALGQPVWRLLGGAFHKQLRAYASILFGATPKATEQIGKRLVEEKGFSAVKFGWEPMGPDEKLDVALVEHARKGIGDKNLLMIDAGCPWDARTAMRRERLFRPFGLTWLEEPLHQDDVAGYGRLTAVSETPIAAGEGEATRGDFQRLMDEGGLDIVQIDPCRVGITETMKVVYLADDRHRRVVNHSYKTRISIAASLHFLAASRSAFVLEYCVEDSPLLNDLTNERFPVVDGMVEVPDAPGLGVTLNNKTIDKYRVA